MIFHCINVCKDLGRCFKTEALKALVFNISLGIVVLYIMFHDAADLPKKTDIYMYKILPGCKLIQTTFNLCIFSKDFDIHH